VVNALPINNNNNNIIIIIIIIIIIMAYLVKARTVEAEKHALLANGSETTFVSRQRLCKHVPKVMDTHGTIQVLLQRCFLLGPFKGVIRSLFCTGIWRVNQCEGGVECRDPASRRRRRKGKSQN
jgi:hypothetical protein